MLPKLVLGISKTVSVCFCLKFRSCSESYTNTSSLSFFVSSLWTISEILRLFRVLLKIERTIMIRTSLPISQTNESTSSHAQRPPAVHISTESKKTRHRIYVPRWILSWSPLSSLCLCAVLVTLTMYIVSSLPSSLIREIEIQWLLQTKPRKLVSSDCSLDKWEIESTEQDAVQCTYKTHWDYIWFQHVRKAGGSSVCRMLRDNGIAAEHHNGEKSNCGLYTWDWYRQFHVDLDGLKCM